jgi:hypothetical protein
MFVPGTFGNAESGSRIIWKIESGSDPQRWIKIWILYFTGSDRDTILNMDWIHVLSVWWLFFRCESIPEYVERSSKSVQRMATPRDSKSVEESLIGNNFIMMASPRGSKSVEESLIGNNSLMMACPRDSKSVEESLIGNNFIMMARPRDSKIAEESLIGNNSIMMASPRDSKSVEESITGNK